MIVPAATLAAIPDELLAEEAGPFMCAGVTVYNALRNSGARGGDVVAVHGIGGLGHLGVQYARQMGFVTVAVGRGRTKNRWRKNSARTITLIRTLRMRRRNCKSVAVHA